jgi:predicted naringenin-chalcone synthase
MNQPRIASGRVFLASLARAVPGRPYPQKESLGFLLANYADLLSSRHLAFLKRISANASIRTRYFAFASPEVLLAETPDQRIARFAGEAVRLAGQAVRQALERAGLTPAEIRGLVVNTCTGYLCPGLSSYLIEELGFSRSIRAYDLVGGGCGGALPNLQLAGPLVRESGGPVVSVAVEICSATFQMEDDPGLLLSNALFSDGAAAAVLRERPGGWRLVAAASHHLPQLREAIRYVHRNGQLYNQLSFELPGLIGEAVSDLLSEFLGQQGLSGREIRHWALHAGGEKVIDAIQRTLGLDQEQLAPTRRVLAEYGNLSSPTVLFVLDLITAGGVQAGERCLLLSFGAGLSLHAQLLEWAVAE